MSCQVSAFGLSDVGLVRRRNEDVWAIVPEQRLYLLADGMGGHRSGDVAAREAVGTLARLLTERLPALPADAPLYDVCWCIRMAFEEVNRAVYQLGKTDEGLRGMGTTLCCLHVHDEGIILAHVGDSRIYRLSHGELEQVTEDHSLLSELISSGQIPAESAGLFTYKNIITKAVGTEPIVEPSVNAVELCHGDLFLMCSDGLSDLLVKEEIEAVLATTPDLQEAAQSLLEEAKRRGGYDNITVILLRIDVTDEASHLPR